MPDIISGNEQEFTYTVTTAQALLVFLTVLIYGLYLIGASTLYETVGQNL